MEFKLSFFELLSIISLSLTPFFVLLLTYWLNKKQLQREKQLSIFRILISQPINILTLDKEYVAALNLVFVEFRNCDKIMHERRELQKLFDQNGAFENIRKQMDILLVAIADVLKIKIKDLDVIYGSYLPQHWINEGNKRNYIDNLSTEVLEGRRSISINIVSPDISEKED